MVRRVDRSPPVSRSLSTSASPSQRDPGSHDRLWRESPSGFCKPAYGVGDRLAEQARVIPEGASGLGVADDRVAGDGGKCVRSEPWLPVCEPRVERGKRRGEAGHRVWDVQDRPAHAGDLLYGLEKPGHLQAVPGEDVALTGPPSLASLDLAASHVADVDEVIAALNREEHRSFDGVADDPAHFRKAVIMRADHAGGADDHGI